MIWNHDMNYKKNVAFVAEMCCTLLQINPDVSS